MGAMLENLGSQLATMSGGLSFAHPTWDLFLLLFLVVGTLLFGFALGRDRIMVIMIAMYMALVAASHVPWGAANMTAVVSFDGGFALRVGVFVSLFVVLFLLLTRSALHYAMAGFRTFGSWWESLLLALMQTGLTASVFMSFCPANFIASRFSPLTRSVFISAWGQFIWVLLPIVVLLIIGQSENRVRERYDR